MVIKVVAGILTFLGLIACGNNPGQQPLEVVWGRDIGEISSMAVSDPRYAAQVIEKSGRGMLFVEIGTAIQFVASKKNVASLKIWVNDFNSHKWIDARTASWKPGFRGSPMGFGYRAYQEKVAGSIPFTEVYDQVLSENNLIKTNRKKYLLNKKLREVKK